MYWYYGWHLGAKKRAMAELAAQLGLEYQSSGEDGGMIKGEFHGRRFRIHLYHKRVGKQAYDVLESRLELPDPPEGLVLTHEGLGSGFRRFLGKTEHVLGDRDFDSAFWIEGDEAQLQEYLTPERRDALLRWLLPLRGGALREGFVEVERRLDHPFYGVQVHADLLHAFLGLAAAFTGHPPSEGSARPAAGFVVRSKTRDAALLTAVGAPIVAGLTYLTVAEQPWAATTVVVLGGGGLLVALAALSGTAAGRLALTLFHGLAALLVAVGGLGMAWLVLLAEGVVAAALILVMVLVLLAVLVSSTYYLKHL